MKTYLGRVVLDIEYKVSGNAELQDHFSPSFEAGHRLAQQQRNYKNKLYSLHAPEVEYIAKGKAHKKYEFRCKVTVATTSRDNLQLTHKRFTTTLITIIPLVRYEAS